MPGVHLTPRLTLSLSLAASARRHSRRPRGGRGSPLLRRCARSSTPGRRM